MKGHMLRDPVYGKCPQQANPQRQKAEQWLPGAGGGGCGVAANGDWATF